MSSEIGKIYRALKERDQDDRASLSTSNMEVLKNSGVNYRENCTVVIFRGNGLPNVDFYSSKDSWWCHDTKKRMYGDVHEFLTWYKSGGNK